MVVAVAALAVAVLILLLLGLLWWWGREGKLEELVRPAVRPFRAEMATPEAEEKEGGAAERPAAPSGGPDPSSPPEEPPPAELPPPEEEAAPAAQKVAGEDAPSLPSLKGDEDGQRAKGVKAMPDPLVRVEVVVGENTTQLMEETTVTLPVAALKVRNVTAKVTDVAVEVIPDKVLVQGTIHKQIFYVGTDDIVHHLAEEVPFSTFVAVPGAQPGMNAQAYPTVAHVSSALLNPTTLLQKAILDLMVKVTQTQQLNLVTGTGPLVRVDQVIGENAAQAMEEGTVILATPASKVSEILVTFQNVVAEAIADKVIVQGTLHKQIFYVGPDEVEAHQAEDIPFSHFVDLPGSVPGLDVETRLTVEHVTFELLSPTELLEKVVFEIAVRVTQSVQLNVALLETGPLVKLEEVRGENTTQTLQETTVTLARPALKVRDVVASVTGVTSEAIPDKVIVQGTVHKQLYYVGLDNLEYHQVEEVPFSLFVDIPGVRPGMRVYVRPTVTFVTFELVSETQVQQKVVLDLFVKVTEEVQLNVEVGGA
ncbi:MAG: DUF3794 domain-containing protein [Bacillota bacterium]|nr:DUF3794 domain-containing protein [Bacillota bacterium]